MKSWAFMLDLQLQILQEMKIFLIFLLSFTINAEILQVEHWILDNWMDFFCGKCKFSTEECQANIKNISSLNATGNFSIPSNLTNNQYGIQNVTFQTYTTQKHTYVFPAANITTRSKYSVYYPNTLNGQISGIVMYYHPTTFGRWNGPSSKLSLYWKSLGVFYGTQNYVVIMPDFNFQNETDPHPYIFYPQQIVQQALVILDEAFDNITKYYPSMSKPIPLFSVGYSQGGAYSVWMAKCALKGCSFGGKIIDSTKYTYVKAVGLQGAYDLITMMRFLYSNVGTNIQQNYYKMLTTAVATMGKPGLSVLVLLSYCAYSLGTTSYFKIYTNSQFYDMKCFTQQEKRCDIEKKRCNLMTALNETAGDNTIAEAIGSSAVGKHQPGVLLPYGLLENSIYDLFKKTILNDQKLANLAFQSSVTDFASQTTKPIFVFTLGKDSLVSPLNAIQFVEKGKGNSHVSGYTYENDNFKICRVFEGLPITESVDHLSAEMMAHIFALHFINTS